MVPVGQQRAVVLNERRGQAGSVGGRLWRAAKAGSGKAPLVKMHRHETGQPSQEPHAFPGPFPRPLTPRYMGKKRAGDALLKEKRDSTRFFFFFFFFFFFWCLFFCSFLVPPLANSKPHKTENGGVTRLAIVTRPSAANEPLGGCLLPLNSPGRPCEEVFKVLVRLLVVLVRSGGHLAYDGQSHHAPTPCALG